MIKLKDVSFTYQGSDGNNLYDINLHIKKGECVLISGKSGCGKTTILRIINGLIPNFYMGKLSGSIMACNMDISVSPSYKIAEKIGMVYQNPRSQFFNIDTDSEIAFGIENLSYPRNELLRRVDKTIKDIGLQNIMGRGIFELSGGEKQKVAFGSIYAMEPEIYLLDEPSANLDTKCTEQLRQRLKLLKKQGKTIVITEHRLYYLQDIVDRVVYMNKGKIENCFTSKEFFSQSEEKRKRLGLRGFDFSLIDIQNNLLSKETIFELQHISTGYGKKVVIQDMTIEASQGEIIGITGHNGAGKSTLAETICGLRKPISGQLMWKGKPISEKQLLKLSYMVMQDVDYQLFADSVENECTYGMDNVEIEKVLNTLKTLNLLEFREKHPGTLSGGQKQRLAVAVSMICQKKILIFDEPTSGLDLEGMIKVTDLLKKLAEMGKVIFVITHDYEFITEVCTRVVRIDEGTLSFDLPLNINNKNEIARHFIRNSLESEA